MSGSRSTRQIKNKSSHNKKGQEELSFQELAATSTYAFSNGLECRVHGLRKKASRG
jgi:hypothetical protein